MRAAVSALASLKKVEILVDTASSAEDVLEHYYAPLAVFASVSSIESLSYQAELLLDRIPSQQTLAQARGCFTAL